MSTPSTPTPRPQGPQVMFQTVTGKSITVTETYDYEAHGGGRGWEVGIQATPGGRPEKVATIHVGPKPFAQPGAIAEVNWSAWGAQSPAIASEFAEAMTFAAAFANDDLIRYIAEFGDDDGE